MFPRRVQLHPCLFWRKTCGRERILGPASNPGEEGGRGLRVWAGLGGFDVGARRDLRSTVRRVCFWGGWEQRCGADRNSRPPQLVSGTSSRSLPPSLHQLGGGGSGLGISSGESSPPCGQRCPPPPCWPALRSGSACSVCLPGPEGLFLPLPPPDEHTEAPASSLLYCRM